MKAMTYNIKNGGQDDLDYGRLGLIIDVIRDVAPDVLVLQELMYADLFGNRVLHLLENETGMRAFLANAKTGQHVAVFVAKGGRVLKTAVDNHNFHHATLEVVLEGKRGPLTIIGTHLCPHGGENRLAEAQRLANYANADRMVLLMGDLNSLDPWSEHSERLSRVPAHYRSRHLMPASQHEVDTRAIATLTNAGFVDLFHRFGGEGKAYTAPTDRGGGAEFSEMRVDYILGTAPVVEVTKACSVVAGGKAEEASDHYPVVVELETQLK